MNHEPTHTINLQPALQLTDAERVTLLEIMNTIVFTSSFREAIKGDSICIGASVDSGTLNPKVTRATSYNEHAIRALLTFITSAKWCPADLYFSSAALNFNTIAEDHVDFNNEGPSLALGLTDSPASFEGGEIEFLCNGKWKLVNKKLVVESGVWKRHDLFRFPIVFDGCSPHRSRPFSGGCRFSIILFYHTACDALGEHDWAFLRSLGFRLHEAPAPIPVAFLSHYSGTCDFGIAEAVAAEAASVGVKIDIIKRDLLMDGSDLLAAEPYGEDLRMAEAGLLVGYHSSWSCSSFTRIRFTGPRVFPLPVRTRDFPLGLPTNTPEQQREADNGTLMATRSARLCQAVKEANRNFNLRSTATGEQPADPGVAPFPSALLLQEWLDIEKDPDSEDATLALCHYGASVDGNFYSKRLTFRGWLKGLATLSGSCRCPPKRWHGNYSTWDSTRASGSYPVELCKAYATLWLKHYFADDVNALGEVPVTMGAPPALLHPPSIDQEGSCLHSLPGQSQLLPPRQAGSNLHSLPADGQLLSSEGAAERLHSLPADGQLLSSTASQLLSSPVGMQKVGKWGNCLVSSSAPSTVPSTSRLGADVRLNFHQKSRQARKEAEEKDFVGGMRDPLAALLHVPSWENVGARCAVIINSIIDTDDEAKLVSLRLGDADYAGPSQRLLDKIKNEIVQAFDLNPVEQPKPEFGEPSVVSATLFGGLLHLARDPDAAILQDWIVNGAPMGMDADIPTCGIFPPSSKPIPTASHAPSLDLVWNEAFEHYGSVVENLDDASREYERFVSNGFIIDLDAELVSHRFANGHLSHVGVVIKVKRDGTRKVRIVVDMTGSDANPRSRIPERPVLPRPLDPATDAIKLVRKGEHVDFGTADFSDAFCHIFVAPAELANNLVAKPPKKSSPHRKRSRPEVGLLVRLGFGSCGGPLIWSRFAAALGRMAQALLRPQASGARSRLRIYLDDPIFSLVGPPARRRRDLAAVLLLWAAAGFNLSWPRVTIGATASWIGVDYKVDLEAGTITVAIPEKAVAEALELASKLLERPMSSVRILRKLAGKGSCIFSIAPRTRWTIQRLWATVTATLAKGKTASGGGKKGGNRFGLFARKQVELPLKWILAYWSIPSSPLKRVLRCEVPPASLEFVIDACPWGIGGYLVTVASGQVLEFFADALTPADLSRFGQELGEAAGQQIWESLAILVALRLWAKHFADGRALLQIRGDSVVSLRLSMKLSSPSPLLNAIGAEIALQLEIFNIDEVVSQHTPGRLLVLADYLSRMHVPGKPAEELPAELKGAKQRRPPARDDSFYKVWCVSSS